MVLETSCCGLSLIWLASGSLLACPQETMTMRYIMYICGTSCIYWLVLCAPGEWATGGVVAWVIRCL